MIPCLDSLFVTFMPASRKLDSLPGNNVAQALTFVTGRTRVLLVDNEPSQRGRPLLEALRADGIEPDAGNAV